MDTLGFALLIGFFVCIFSLICAFFLTFLDKMADKKDGVDSSKVVSDEEKFRWSDIKTFNKSFWIICASCVLTYTAIFPFIQFVSKMLKLRFHFSDEMAGKYFGIPYTISAAASPFLGILIDKIGRRGLLIICSSFILLAAHVINMFLPDCDQCFTEILPLVLVGIGYSIYAAALWGSIPYVVDKRAIGTAFGFCTAIQNAGMAVAPTIVGEIITATSDDSFHGFFWSSFFFSCICVVCLFLNTWLYLEDIRNNNGELNKVHKEDAINELMQSPTPTERREVQENPNLNEHEKDLILDPNAREAVKRSMLRKSMAL
jgi:nitrate/nitrite transporter NarK